MIDQEAKIRRQVRDQMKALLFGTIYGGSFNAVRSKLRYCPQCSTPFFETHPDDGCDWGRVQRVQES